MGKGTRAEILAMKAELEVMGSTLVDIQQTHDAGKFLDAMVKAQNLKDQALALTADIAQAKAKKRG